MKLARRIWSLWSGVYAVLGRGKNKKTTIVICPTAELPAQIAVDAEQRMESCSRWPQLERCSQTCMPQVQFSADTLQEFLARYEGKSCTLCGATMNAYDWYESRLAAIEEKAAPRGGERVSLLSPSESAPICANCFGQRQLW